MDTSNVAPVPSPEGHDAAMAAAFDASQAQAATAAPAAQPATPPAAERPAWLPEGIETPEDFRAAFDALMAEQQAAPPAPEQATAEQAAEAASAAGVDFPALEAEFAANGGLKPETYAMLEGKGFNKATVDSYIAGQTAIAERIQSEVFSSVGGVEGYSQMTAWAAQNLTPAEVEAFDNAVSNGTVETIKMAVAGLNARYRDAVGNEPNLLGGGGGNTQTDVFRSTAEITAAMSDPRYAKDAAYRADVEAKLGRSSIL